MAQRASSLPTPSKSIKTGYLFIAASVVLALVTGTIFFNIVMGIINNAAKPTATHQVVVARNLIPAGQIITADQLKTIDWPANLLPEGEMFENPSALVGRVSRTDIQPSEPVYRAKLAGELSTGGLKILIPKGLRAMTVAVTEVTGVGGFVKPGDRVDVVAIFKNVGNGENRLQKSQTILQDVIVMAAAQQMSVPASVQREHPDNAANNATAKPEASVNPTDKNTPPSQAQNSIKEEPAHVVTSVTLALSPAQIEKLALADETAQIRLVLRSEDDHALNTTPGVTNTELTGVASIQSNNKPAPLPPVNMYAPTSYAPPAKRTVSGHVVEFIDSGQKSEWTY